MKLPTEWTTEERLILIKAISQQISEAARTGKGFGKQDIYDLAECIFFASHASPEFLNNNRRNFLRVGGVADTK